MSTDENARCGFPRVEYAALPPPSAEFVRLMETLNGLPFIPSTPPCGDDRFYRLWMEGEQKFEVIDAGEPAP